MARIRTIKPEFFTSEDIVALSMAARLLYVALWCEADREGRMRWKPRTFKMRYFPADSIEIDACARELIASGLVVTYGDGLAHIPSFGKHQHLNPREAASTLPEPPKADASTLPEPPKADASTRVSDASAREEAPSLTRREEGKGKEGKGKEEELPSTTGEKAAEEPDLIWSHGLSWMKRKGVTEGKARGTIGLAIKETDRLTVATLLQQAESDDVVEPVSWLLAAVKHRKSNVAQLSLVPAAPEPIKASHQPLRHTPRG